MKKMYMNTDVNTATFPFFDKVAEQKRITPEMLYPYIDVHRHTQITDFVINVFAQVSTSDTDFGVDYADIYEASSEEGGFFSRAKIWEGLYKIQRVHGIDVYSVWIDRCRQVGFNPWISFRMNDCHNPDTKAPVSENDFFFEARKNGWTLGEEYGYYRHCLDYSVSEVRSFMLSYTREQLSRYNVYGLELDFLREYHCFKYLSADMAECRNIMTGFIREVKNIVTDCEKIHGHKIKLMLRLPRDIEHCLYYGFDPVEMAKEKLIDTVVPSPRFAGSDSGINVDAWRAALPGVEIIPGIEAAVGVIDGKFVDTSKEISLGLCANYLSYAPDGLYFFNYFITPRIFESFYDEMCESEKERIEGNEPYEKSFITLQCGADYKTIYQSAIRFVIIPEGFEACAGYPTMWRPIPRELGECACSFELRTGAIPKGKKCAVILGFDGEAEGFDVAVNGTRVGGFEKIDMGFIEGIGYQPRRAVSEKTVCYRGTFDESVLTSPTQIVNVSSHTEGKILNWVEINVY